MKPGGLFLQSPYVSLRPRHQQNTSRRERPAYLGKSTGKRGESASKNYMYPSYRPKSWASNSIAYGFGTPDATYDADRND